MLFSAIVCKFVFSANDSDPQSVVEAGVDGFKVSSFECLLPMDVTGMAIIDDILTVVLIEDESVTGGMSVIESQTSPLYEIWLSNSSKELFQPDPDLYSFEIEIEDTELADFTNNGDWQFSIDGLLAGQTNMTIAIGHSDIIDYTSPNISLQINPPYVCGDANSSGSVNVSDAVAIINFVFSGGTPPNPLISGDTNCDSKVNVSDAVYIINYVFSGGNAPCDTNGDGTPDC